MDRVLIASIAALAAIFLLLTLGIVAAKSWREWREARRRARRRALEPGVLAWSHGDDASLLPLLNGPVDWRDRRALEELLLDHIQRVRGIERDRLGRALDELGYVDRWLARLGRRAWWHRADAAEKLGLARAVRAVDRLAEALHDDVHEVRLRAARSLGALGGVTAIRPLVEALRRPDRWSTIRVADILVDMGPAVVDELVETFPSLSTPAKLAALDILARTRAVRATPWLRTRLHDFHADVRARACHALGAIGGPDAGPALAEALGDAQWPVRAMAAKALGRVRHLASIPVLTGALGDRSWWVRSNAAEALREMGEPGLRALVGVLEDPDAFARHQAVLMLEQSGTLDHEVARLASPDPAAREAARGFVEAVARTGRLDRLRALELRHDDPRVREALTGLLPPAGRAREATA